MDATKVGVVKTLLTQCVFQSLLEEVCMITVVTSRRRTHFVQFVLTDKRRRYLPSKVDEMSVVILSILDNPTFFLESLFTQRSDVMDMTKSNMSEMPGPVSAMLVHFVPRSSGNFSTFGIIASEMSLAAFSEFGRVFGPARDFGSMEE
jgi:hypothetical protein